MYLFEQLIVYCIITGCWNVDSYLKKPCIYAFSLHKLILNKHSNLRDYCLRVSFYKIQLLNRWTYTACNSHIKNTSSTTNNTLKLFVLLFRSLLQFCKFLLVLKCQISYGRDIRITWYFVMHCSRSTWPLSLIITVISHFHCHSELHNGVITVRK